jgi:hypothetical protein
MSRAAVAQALADTAGQLPGTDGRTSVLVAGWPVDRFADGAEADTDSEAVGLSPMLNGAAARGGRTVRFAAPTQRPL